MLRDRGLLPGVARQLVAGLAAHQRDRVADPADRAPRVRPARRRRRPRPARPRGPRRAPPASGSCAAPGTWPAYRICSSWTVHSMSASPPRPSLRWVCGSAPRGSRSWSTRALIRRTSSTSSSEMPSRGEAQRVDQLLEAPAQLEVPDHGVGAQQRLRLPDLRPLGVVARRTSPGSAPAPPACPPGAGRRRPTRAGSAPGQREQPAQLVGDGGRVRRRHLRLGSGLRVVDEQHVGVAAVGQLEAAVAAHRHDRHPRSARSSKPRCSRTERPATLQGRLQGGVGQPRQRRTHVGDVDEAEQVTGAIRKSSRRRIARTARDRLLGVDLSPRRRRASPR